MIRINQRENAEQTVVSVAGELSGAAVRLTDDLCLAVLRRGRQLLLDLQELRDIDAEGLELLRRMLQSGARLSGRGVYTGYLLKRLARGARGDAQ